MNPQRKFLELTMMGKGKKLYIPSDSVLSYEFVAEGKNPSFPEAGTFVRYDYGEGLSFAIVNEGIEYLKEQVGTEGFLQFHLVDDAELWLKDGLIIAIQEQEDEDIEMTRLSLNLNGQVGSLMVKETYEDIKKLREPTT
jgi:hypothetical protein